MRVTTPGSRMKPTRVFVDLYSIMSGRGPHPPVLGGVWVLLLEPYSRREHARVLCVDVSLCTQCAVCPSCLCWVVGGPFAAHQHTPPPGRPGVWGVGKSLVY